jgi:hypothetical protein
MFARNWPLKAWLLFGAILGAVLAGRACEPSISALGHWWVSALLAGSVAVGSVAGFFCAVALAPIVLTPLYYRRAIRNGAPFHEGDYVRVLVAPYQDVIARVYEIWTDRNQLRIELGTDARRAVEDVFSFVQVCRDANEPAHAPEPAAGPVTNGTSLPPDR